PPVLLEYDEDTNLKTVYLENTSLWTAARHSKTAQPMAIGARWWSIASRA
ncbi:hypothetical protein XGA_0185, partial [Xanthomonas hortorum ATCC 19865]